ncbi:signal peptidase I [Treponema brennaborense]|uniref:Signal peptidase I n=1 Tax=Treponema brennaborense (strain DSM 12168 / CIP 105900 / DD5/3) TaxID=906968 RepID=F4LJB1_TREBD|nr:signal peptidase I [Treponema brennaborense]AEE17356.1 signal peptidase I [Treponema brennaborense DSM 12168]
MKKSKKNSSPLLFVVCGVIAGIVLKLFVVDILNVSGTSMEPAVPDGAVIVVSKLAYGLVKPFGDELLAQWRTPRKGEVVLYFYNDKAVVKRCVATSGEPLDFSTDSGYSLTVADKTIPLTEAQYQRIKHSSEVPSGTILAIGDNYAQSVDSRNYGFVSVHNIIGKVICR